MCNARTSSNDQTPIPRQARGGHIWINLFGRDWIVRRRRPTKLGIIGTLTGCLGVIGLAWGNKDDFRPDLLGILFIVLAVMVICYKRLEAKNLAADEIYNVGRERGETDGYEQGYEDGLQQGRKERPHVIELYPKCVDCGQPAAQQSVGSVADRG